MKKTILLCTILISSQLTFASQMTIDHPCLNDPILETKSLIDANSDNVFSFTKKQIEDKSIEAVLGSDGVISILGYVTGERSLEVISDNKMRAYGWCYSINNEVPDLMPDQIKLTNADVIRWYLSYSTYDNGHWVDYCVPVKSNPEASRFICH